MASDPKDENGITRRDFTSRLGVAAAGVAVGATFLGPASGLRRTSAAASSAPTTGSSTASIGIHSQGNALKSGFAQLKNVEIKTLCDVDENLFASRANDKAVLDKVPTFKPGYMQDLRRVFDDKDIDAVVIAIPNHWHALATHLGRCRPASTSTSRSRPPTPCGKAGRWSTPRAPTTGSCRSAR